MTIDAKTLFRVDSLTGQSTFLAFVETLANLPATEIPPGFPRWESVPYTRWPADTSLLFVDIHNMRLINQARGRTHGDSVIHWLGILLAEESGAEVYRLGGNEFAALLDTGTFAEHKACMERILRRIEKDADSMGMSDPPVLAALIYYEKGAISSPANVLMQISEAMRRIVATRQLPTQVFYADNLGVAALAWTDWTSESRWIAYKSIQNTLWLVSKLDEMQQEAHLDLISGLPNMSAALLHLEQNLAAPTPARPEFSILLIDGDNIRQYNDVNYAAGDKLIRDLGAVFKQHLRPGDFVARWRTGDEFIVVLPATGTEGARLVGERFRKAVKEASQGWLFPETISIGVATFPTHARAIQPLVDAAESALKRAKAQGKDQVVVA